MIYLKHIRSMRTDEYIFDFKFWFSWHPLLSLFSLRPSYLSCPCSRSSTLYFCSPPFALISNSLTFSSHLRAFALRSHLLFFSLHHISRFCSHPAYPSLLIASYIPHRFHFMNTSMAPIRFLHSPSIIDYRPTKHCSPSPSLNLTNFAISLHF